MNEYHDPTSLTYPYYQPNPDLMVASRVARPAYEKSIRDWWNQSSVKPMYENNIGALYESTIKPAIKPQMEAFKGSSTQAKTKGTLEALQGVFDAYNSYKANKLAKEQFAFNKMEANRNYDAQKRTVNAQLADRQAARYARDPSHFASVSDYMAKYGVK